MLNQSSDRLPILDEPDEDEDSPPITRGSSWKCPPIVPLLKKCCGVEIPVFVYFVALGILLPAQNHFIYNRICLYEFNSSDICERISKDPALSVEEDKLQRDFSFYSTLQLVLLYLLSTIATLFMGTWCDRFSFRIPLIVPHFGTALGTLLYVVFYFLPYEATHPLLMSLPSVIYGLTGASSTEITTAFAYAARISSVQQRTVKVAVIEAAIGLGQTSGYLISALVLGRSNSLLAFVTQICCSLYACLFIYLFVPELHLFTFRDIANREARGSLLRLFFLPGAKVINGFKIAVRKFPVSLSNGMRRYILLFVVPLGICFISMSGISSITYAFVSKQPISLSRSLYAVFQALMSGLISFNLLVTLRVLKLQWHPWLPLSDITLATIGATSRIISYIVMGFADFFPAYAPWIFAFLSMLSGFFATSLRSLLSKFVSPSEKGSLFALIGIIESISGMLASTIYNVIYAECIPEDGSTPNPFLRGLVFFFSTGLFLSPIAIFLWLLYTNQVSNFPLYNQNDVSPISDGMAVVADSTAPSEAANQIANGQESSDRSAVVISDRRFSRDGSHSSSNSFDPEGATSNPDRVISLRRI